MRLIKFGPADPTEVQPHEWGDIFCRRTLNDSSERLEIGVSIGQIDLIRELLLDLEPPFRMLYVLIVPRSTEVAGRYEAPEEFTRGDIDGFLDRYGAILEQDGRHAIWLSGVNGTLVYTPHDIIYAYGPVNEFEKRLKRRDFVERDVSINVPHSHHYHEHFDPAVRDLLSSREWRHFPLSDMDDET
jgi:hypothetical protein